MTNEAAVKLEMNNIEVVLFRFDEVEDKFLIV